MHEWQDQYIRNVQEIKEILPLFGMEKTDFDTWYAGHLAAEARIKALREENNRLLSDNLFPALDTLHSADKEETNALVRFAGRLMDWKTNLDCGVYVAIHDALLSLYRVRKDRAGVIRELYMLGMGLYYLHRSVTGVECRETESMHFQNEMLFTEAGSYFRYFQTIQDDDTRAYILRAMANVSICTTDFKRRIDASMNFIQVVKSPEYRAMAPSLPWNTYLRRAHQQLSTSRSQLSNEEITQAEVAAVMDSCYEVFKPESQSAEPSLRWLWPYYEMEFHCGYVSLETTVERLETLIREAPEDKYDESGLYGCVQLPIYLGRYMRKNEKLQRDAELRRFLGEAYRKMLRMLMTIPPAMCDENFHHALVMVISDFFEMDGLLSYQEVTARLMQRFAGRLYLQSLKASNLLSCICDFIWNRDPKYFSQLPVLAGIEDTNARRETLLRFARDCGLYHDFGLFKMNMERIQHTRQLFENEDAMYRLHTVSGYDDLRQRESAQPFADIARGHHSSYTGESDPSGYVRMESPFRQMTDLTALVSDLMENETEGVAAWAKGIRQKSRFSPQAAAFLTEKALLDALDSILTGQDMDNCRTAYDFYWGKQDLFSQRPGKADP